MPNLTGGKGTVVISKGALSLLLFILLVVVIKMASGFDGSGTLIVSFDSVGGLLMALKLTPTSKHRRELTDLFYHKLLVIYSYPSLVVITQFLSCIILLMVVYV